MCSVCGYAVDVVRSCYSSKWNFPKHGVIAGYYFFRPAGTPFYPGWTFFGSRNWHKGDGTPWPDFGELENVKQVWRDGSYPAAHPPAVFVGTKLCIEGFGVADSSSAAAAAPRWGLGPGIPIGPIPPVDTPPPSLVGGVDVRCWGGLHVAFLVASGGIKLGNARADYDGAGGLKIDGAADLVHHEEAPKIGGVRLGGVATEYETPHMLAAGGVRLGGVATEYETPHMLAAGGVRLGGAAGLKARVGIAGKGGVKLDSGAGLHASLPPPP